jgi:TetR/AcrR family tetracycline transcriptional repressor
MTRSQAAGTDERPARARRGREGTGRPGLTRDKILRSALKLVDHQGLSALTMRSLGAELGVDPMAVYKHLANKDALLDGLAELLWSEVEVPDDGVLAWKDRLRLIARSLRSLAHTHPNAYPLLFRRCLSEPALGVFDAQLDALGRAGIKRELAAQGVRALVTYAVGYGMAELSPLLMNQLQGSDVSDVQRVMRVMQSLPRDLSPRLAEVACVVCECDVDKQFDFGLDLIMGGLEAQL